MIWWFDLNHHFQAYVHMFSIHSHKSLRNIIPELGVEQFVDFWKPWSNNASSLTSRSLTFLWGIQTDIIIYMYIYIHIYPQEVQTDQALPISSRESFTLITLLRTNISHLYGRGKSSSQLPSKGIYMFVSWRGLYMYCKLFKQRQSLIRQSSRETYPCKKKTVGV